MRRSIIPFTGYPLDRADHLRKDDRALSALRDDPAAPVAVFWRGRPLVEERGDTVVLTTVPRSSLGEAIAVQMLLGLDDEGRAVMAVSLDPALEKAPLPRGSFQDLRVVAGRMSLGDAALAGTARSVFAWHRGHRFCPHCGKATEVASAGWKRHCPGCDKEHFPRFDPVVIMLITRQDQVLLGRGPNWPRGFFSCLAGFVEPGETLGDATRREAWEEAKVRLGDVRYLFSQPWPFPSSLMLGVRAEAEGDEIAVDGVELAEARWFSRGEVVDMLEGRHPDAIPPFPIAVAHHLLRGWVETPAG